MEPVIVERDALLLVGLATYGKPPFADVWHRFGPHMSVPNRADNSGVGTWDAYGVELYPPEFAKTREWTYFAGVAVTNLDDVPAPMLVKPIPAALYAVFTVVGGVPAIGPAFHHAYDEWLPASNWDIALPYDIEHYDERFERKGNEQELEIWIPVKPR